MRLRRMINLTVHINIDGSGNPQKVAAQVRGELSGIINELKQELESRNLKRKVAYEKNRNDERT